MIKVRKEIDRLLWANIKRLEQPGWSFAYDSNLNPPSVFDTAELRVLVVFLSDGSARAVSSTDLALNGLIKSRFGDRVFVDLCYFPMEKTREVFDEIQVPWMIGDVSHAPAEDYDLVLVSNSIISERHNLYVYFRKSGIEPWANKRLNDKSTPLFLMGGSSSDVASSLYGDSLDGTGKSLVDLTYVGFAEGYLGDVIQEMLEFKKQGKVRDKREIMDHMYKFSCVFSPLDYQWIYEPNSIRIKEIKKHNPKAHDQILYAKPNAKDLTDSVGFSNKILHSEGSFDSVDEIISYGCSSGGSCRFCVAEGTEVQTYSGIKKIEELKVGDMVATRVGWQPIRHTHDLGMLPALRLGLKNGDELVCGEETHRVETKTGWRYVKSLRKGEVVLVNEKDFSGILDPELRKLEVPCEGSGDYSRFPYEIDRDLAWLVGYWWGDGCIRKSGSSYVLAVDECERVEVRRIMREKFGLTKEWEFYDGPSEKVYKIEISKSEFGEFLKVVAEKIFSTGLFAREFLGGLVQADGWCNSASGIDIVSSSYEKLVKVRKLVRVMGVRGSLKSYDREAGEGYNSKRTVRCILHMSTADLPLLENKAYRRKSSGALIRGSAVEVLEKAGMRKMYDITLDSPHQYYPNFISSHQCHEGGLISWREVPLKAHIEKMKRAKQMSLANSYNSYSYNTPYHSQLNDILWNASNIFDSISAIAFRADICAARPEFVKMFRTLGAQRQTVAIEGVSSRIRNGYLNKNLSWDELHGCIKAFFENRFMQMKLFLILTGIETKEDFTEFWQEMDKVLEMRAQMGANTAFVLSFTPLVCFPNTALMYEPRRTCHNLFYGKKNLGEFIDNARARGLRVRFSSRGKNTIYEQLLLDMGPLFTKYYERCFDTFGWVFANHIPDKVVDGCLGWMQKEDKLVVDEVFAGRPYDFIFPDSLVKANNPQFLIESHKKAVAFQPEAMCLPTVAKPKSGGCAKCGQCATPAEIKKIQTRKIENSEKTLTDILLVASTTKSRYRYRAVFAAAEKACALKKKALASFLLAKVFADQCLNVSRIENDPAYWCMSEDFPFYYWGKYVVDITSKSPLVIPTKFPSTDLMTLQSIVEIPVNSAYSIKDYALTLVTLPYDNRFVDALTHMEFNKYPFDDSTNMMKKWGEFVDKKTLQPLIKVAKDKIYLLMDFPLKSNAVKYLSLATGYTYRKVLETADVRILGYYSRGQYKTCKVCNKNHTYMDLATMKIAENCIHCSGKFLLSKV